MACRTDRDGITHWADCTMEGFNFTTFAPKVPRQCDLLSSTKFRSCRSVWDPRRTKTVWPALFSPFKLYANFLKLAASHTLSGSKQPNLVSSPFQLEIGGLHADVRKADNASSEVYFLQASLFFATHYVSSCLHWSNLAIIQLTLDKNHTDCRSGSLAGDSQ